MSEANSILPPLDIRQRYTIPEAAAYLRCSRAYLYRLIERDELRELKDGRRTYITGAEIARKSILPDDQSAAATNTSQTAAESTKAIRQLSRKTQTPGRRAARSRRLQK